MFAIVAKETEFGEHGCRLPCAGFFDDKAEEFDSRLIKRHEHIMSGTRYCKVFRRFDRLTRWLCYVVIAKQHPIVAPLFPPIVGIRLVRPITVRRIERC